jgi:hypothetical protein
VVKVDKWVIGLSNKYTDLIRSVAEKERVKRR